MKDGWVFDMVMYWSSFILCIMTACGEIHHIPAWIVGVYALGVLWWMWYRVFEPFNSTDDSERE